MAALLQVDFSSANRFVSSLSKSLQALCHGCMDFDTQIEIIGYLNVNIDCNCKVDCVLNEKVSKSEDNSMTFISNSFLAKKDEPKSLSERSCSPIAELITRRHYQGKASGYSNSSSHQYRSSGIFSPHSQIVRSAQKRPWRGSQRHGAKSSRLQEPHWNPSFHEGTSQQSTSISKTAEPNTHFDHSNSNSSQTDVCIKTENPESITDIPHPVTSSSGNETTDSTNINIKPDPDSADIFQSQSNFLQTSINPDTREQSFFKPVLVPSEGQNVESGTAEQSVEDMGNEGFSGAQADYDKSEEQSYSQSMFGDESGDASQFDNDIIEIDDEDEYVEQFTGDDGLTYMDGQLTQRQFDQKASDSRSDQTTTIDTFAVLNVSYDSETRQFLCQICGKGFGRRDSAMRHYMNIHKKVFSHPCTICGKGFSDKPALEGHMVCHGMPMKFQCKVCWRKFTRKQALSEHLKSLHRVVLDFP